MTKARRAKLDATAAEMRARNRRFAPAGEPDLALYVQATCDLVRSRRVLAAVQRTVFLHEMRVACLRPRAFPAAPEPAPPAVLPPAA
jgi:hypothetical protein